jgi:DNA-binding response OmpR family regulator
MSEKNAPLVIVDGDDVSRRALGAVLDAYMAVDEGFPRCEVVDQGDDVEGALVIGEGAFARPLRVGALIERLFLLERQRQHVRDIAVGVYVLDSAYGQLVRAGGENIDLTDKECELLVCLHAAHGRGVSRAALLRDVWGYVDDLETHTLETHIYRLRQKIEDDPAKPVILVTRDDGYALA